MANYRTNKKNSSGSISQGSQAIIIFWLIFVIVIISVFMLNAETIKRNFNILKTRLTDPAGSEKSHEEEMPPEPQSEVVIIEPSQTETGTRPAAESQPAQTGTETRQPSQTDTAAPVQTRDRNVYYAQIDKDGQILQSRVIRKIQVSNSPMVDVLNVMLAGPSGDEINRGIINLIPKNTRILSAAVRGSTAYISFSEDFLFNTFGVEGYVAQLRQIVWTVTEFSNVEDVQILIEGNRYDYLGEGIWIGSPINRQSF
ncbi:MAG: GerMN domain-containing protein [Treponema sp.]|nr:GerMN domain-containing protein [Treponema sp.]